MIAFARAVENPQQVMKTLHQDGAAPTVDYSLLAISADDVILQLMQVLQI